MIAGMQRPCTLSVLGLFLFPHLRTLTLSPRQMLKSPPVKSLQLPSSTPWVRPGGGGHSSLVINRCP